jgi:LEA14-like dessication related protein
MGSATNIGCQALLSALALCAIFACAASPAKPEQPQPTLEKPRFDFRDVQFEDPSFTGMKVVFRFELASTDAREFQVVACPYQWTLDDKPAPQGVINPGAGVGPDKKLMITTSVEIPWPKTPTEIVDFLKHKEIRYSFSQTCNLQGAGGGLTVSGADSGMIPLPNLPQMIVSGANAQRFGAKEARLNFELSIANENSFGIKVDRIHYRISIKGKLLNEGDMEVGESIPANHETSFDIPAAINSEGSNQDILSLLNQPSVPYQLEGKVFFGAFEVGIKGEGSISFAH